MEIHVSAKGRINGPVADYENFVVKGYGFAQERRKAIKHFCG